MPFDIQGRVGSSKKKAIPTAPFLSELSDNKRRNEFVADQVRVRLALLIRSLREQRKWSQADLGQIMGKPQSNISRLEDPDYGKLSLQTLFELANAFGLPLYIDMPNWDEWFGLMEDMSSRSLQRESFDIQKLLALSYDALPTFGRGEATGEATTDVPLEASTTPAPLANKILNKPTLRSEVTSEANFYDINILPRMYESADNWRGGNRMQSQWRGVPLMVWSQ